MTILCDAFYMKARFIQEVGTKGRLRIYWDTSTLTAKGDDGCRTWKDHSTCPNCLGTGQPGYHNAYTQLGTVETVGVWNAFGQESDYPPERWPTACFYCGAAVPEAVEAQNVGDVGIKLHRQVFLSRLYNTASGEPEAGDIYETHYHEKRSCPFWDNCDGTHIFVILPNGRDWDVDSRASNCTMKDDRTHRCWIRHGTPPNLTVDKNGHTCAAGAGSIDMPGWHGFLRNGELVR